MRVGSRGNVVATYDVPGNIVCKESAGLGRIQTRTDRYKADPTLPICIGVPAHGVECMYTCNAVPRRAAEGARL